MRVTFTGTDTAGVVSRTADTGVKARICAGVSVAGETVGEIGPGILVLLGLDKGDDQATGERMLERMLAYRLFSDDQGRMNRNVQEVGGGVLLVSQFTLSADTRKGLRPGFSTAATPMEGERLFNRVVERVRTQHAPVATGQFGANMQVALLNDGPVTFLLQN